MVLVKKQAHVPLAIMKILIIEIYYKIVALFSFVATTRGTLAYAFHVVHTTLARLAGSGGGLFNADHRSHRSADRR